MAAHFLSAVYWRLGINDNNITLRTVGGTTKQHINESPDKNYFINIMINVQGH